mmetsp:Transcript_100836/g.178922  ORF Transcript_100836/g.178922 Transcript_100836/m.178922 type:complete len:555 (+) Transcript_100836:38-1702(+)
MAAQLASILDALAPWQDLAINAVECLNVALQEIEVSPNCNLMITIVDRHYVFASDGFGKLEVTMPESGRPWAMALCRAQARGVIEVDVLKELRTTKSSSQTFEQDMMRRRKIRIEGDPNKWNTFMEQIERYMGRLQRKLQELLDASAEALHAHEQHIQLLTDEEQQAYIEELAIVASDQPEVTSDRGPNVQQLWGFLMFSAFGTMGGNVGQSNYNAANAIKDLLAFQQRIFCAWGFMPLTIMWGPVTGLGMRSKAFGSQDALLKVENVDDTVFDFKEASTMLGYIISGIACEWVGLCKIDKVSRDYINNSGPYRNPDAWGLGKLKGSLGIGRGGGLTMEEDGQAPPEEKETEPVEIDPEPFPGKRVLVHGLEKFPQMNGVKGSLVEESFDSLWRVRLDGYADDKLIKVDNLQTLSGVQLITAASNASNVISAPKPPAPAPAVKATKPAVSAAKPAANKNVEYALAGTWTEWMPQNMDWDDDKQCPSLTVNITRAERMMFSVARGRAGTRKLGNKMKRYVLGSQPGSYRVNLSLRDDGVMEQVDVVRIGDAEPLP